MVLFTKDKLSSIGLSRISILFWDATGKDKSWCILKMMRLSYGCQDMYYPLRRGELSMMTCRTVSYRNISSTYTGRLFPGLNVYFPDSFNQDPVVPETRRVSGNTWSRVKICIFFTIIPVINLCENYPKIWANLGEGFLTIYGKPISR